MMKNVYTMSEHDSLFIDGYRLTSDDQKVLVGICNREGHEEHSHRLIFEELVTGLRLKSNSWVGVVELERATIFIKPKFDTGFEALIELLCFVNQIPIHQMTDTKAKIGTSNFAELFVRLFLMEIARLKKYGIRRDYVEVDDNLRVIRGRPNLVQTLRENFAAPTKVFCRYDEFDTNTLENQLLRTGLSIAARFTLLPETRQRVKRILGEFDSICDLFPGREWPEIAYNRLNCHYERAHRLAKYLFEGSMVERIFQRNEGSFYSMLVDMNRLFELFVTKLLQTYCDEDYTVQASRSISDAIMKDGKCYAKIIPDLLLINRVNGSRIVMDVKYKNYGVKKVEMGDIYQLAFYALHHHRNSVDRWKCAIFYPQYNGPASEHRELVLDIQLGTPPLGKLYVKGIPINRCLEKIRRGVDDELMEIVQALLQDLAY